MRSDTESSQALGVIGGLGPLASAYFLELLVRLNSADCDQDHLQTIAWNDPTVPDRTAYLLNPGQAASPVPQLCQIARRLESLGVCCLAIPCITAHAFWDAISRSVKVPVLHAVRETAAALQTSGIRRAGVLATTGTLASGMLQRELEAAGIKALTPGGEQQAALMDVIYQQIKAGREPDSSLVTAVAADLRRQGAQTVILGCTELSCLRGRQRAVLGQGYLDMLEVLALRALQICAAQPTVNLRQLIDAAAGKGDG